MSWTVRVTKKAVKQVKKLSPNLQALFFSLVEDLKLNPSVKWRNFGKLKGSKNLYHCHIKHGRPTYVVCWEVIDNEVKIMEVYYVGTHEKAPY